MKLSTRHLISATLYCGAAGCSIAGLVSSMLTDSTFTGADLAFTIIGGVTWGVATGHGLYRAYKNRKTEKQVEQRAVDVKNVADPENPENSDNPKAASKCCPNKELTYSTHEKINSILYLSSAGSYLINDIRALIKSSSFTIKTQCSGTTLWLMSAALSFSLANTEEQQEEEKADVRVWGMSPVAANLLIEAKYLTAATLFSIALFYSDEKDEYEVPSNIFWLIASLHDTTQALYDYCKDRKEKRAMYNAPAVAESQEEKPQAPSVLALSIYAPVAQVVAEVEAEQLKVKKPNLI